MKDIYESFAYDYDEFGEIQAYLGSEREFFEKLCAAYDIKSILDCACGTGQHLYLFSEIGLNVCGSDCSKSMLDVAKRNLNKLGKQVELCQCDFRFLEQVHSNKYDAIACLTTSLPHLHTDEDLITALKSMRRRLNRNGILVLTQGTTHATLKLPSIEVVVNRDDFSRIFVKEHTKEFQTVHVLDLYHTEKRRESNQYEIVYRIILDEDYKRLLSFAGFTDIKIYGDYSFAPYDIDSKRLIVVAR